MGTGIDRTDIFPYILFVKKGTIKYILCNVHMILESFNSKGVFSDKYIENYPANGLHIEREGSMNFWRREGNKRREGNVDEGGQ